MLEVYLKMACLGRFGTYFGMYFHNVFIVKIQFRLTNGSSISTLLYQVI